MHIIIYGQISCGDRYARILQDEEETFLYARIENTLLFSTSVKFNFAENHVASFVHPSYSAHGALLRLEF